MTGSARDDGKGPQIAIDGPSGAGKSTLARSLARRLRLAYVDTGAMYRAVAWKARREGVEDEDELHELLERTELEVVADPDEFAVRVDGEDVTSRLRDPAVGRTASWVATMPAVRTWLVERQRRLARGGAVMEGRDIGTVVLPQADVKFFITADEEVRMRRRAAQLGPEGGRSARDDVRRRDRRDTSREASPLRAAADAVVVDTTDQEPGESLAVLLETVAREAGLH